MENGEPNIHPESLPEASLTRARRGISPVWIVPIAALVAGIWLVYKAVVERGPVILIHFDNAEGIEAGKTHVKYLNVDVGKVTSVRFAPAGSGVEVEVQMAQGTESRLTDTTRFWIVRPRLEATGVSGLGTLVSGAYIGMDPGTGGADLREFTGLGEPPRILSHQSGSIFTLLASDVGWLSVGSPVYFRSIQVGSVVSYGLSEDHSHVLVEVFVESPHDRFVDVNSRFWIVSGIQVETSSEGVQIDVESLAALATGGLAFSTPEAPGARGAVPDDHLFTLFNTRRESEERPVVGTNPYLVYFNESVRGLSPGAAVEYRGMRVGTVRSILPVHRTLPGDVRIGVLLGIDPQLLPFETGSTLPPGLERRVEWVQRLTDSGARVQLKTGNLLTGQKYVDIDIYPNAEPETVVTDMGYPVVPSTPGPLQGITDSVVSILARLDAVPVDAMGAELNTALASLNGSARQLESLLTKVNAEAGPILRNTSRASEELAGLMEEATGAARQFESTLQTLELATSADGEVGHEALQALRELGAAARAIRAVAEYLEHHPEALISGKR